MRRKCCLRLGIAAALCLSPGRAFPEASTAVALPGDQGLLFLQKLDQRIADVSWKIAERNAALCPLRTGAIGVSLHNAAQYSPEYRQAAVDTFGFGDGLPSVLAVAKGSPADLAGLRTGDRLATLDGEALLPALPRPRAKQDYTPIAAVLARLEALPADRPVQIDIRRRDSGFTLSVKATTVCRSRVELVPSGEANANSNGTVVQIYGKLAIWAKTDDELAIIIAHEMAHNILNHNTRIERERIGTGLSAVFGASGQKLREMEREADRYGLYLVARAGYDYRAAPDLWRRLTNTRGLGSVWATTHPTARDRATFNRALVAEIERSKAAGEPLTP